MNTTTPTPHHFVRQMIDQQDLYDWCETRETTDVIGAAIHAAAYATGRSPHEVWESPTEAEERAVLSNAEAYLAAGYYPRTDDGVYSWGIANVRIA